MRRESHRRRGVSRASSGGWGHRAVYVGAVVATAAVIAGFGAAVLIYGPIGSPYRQLSGSTLGSPPVGVSFGTGEEVLATGLPAYNHTTPNAFDVGGYSNASSVCTAAGVFSPGLATGLGFNLTSGNVTAGNTTYVCLNSVGNLTAGGPVGFVNSTWSAGLVGTGYLSDLQGFTAIPDNQSYVNATYGQNITSCNNFTAPATSAPWQSPWNLTHIDNASFVPCNTFYQMNGNTSVLPSFDGVRNATGAAPGNSTIWVVNQTGYLSADVVYEIPVTFANTSTNGTYEISVDIAGVTPVTQTFLFNDTVHGAASGGTVVFVFDMTAAWLFDASYSYNGTGATPSNSTMPEIYGAIGLSSVIITECSSDNVCPVQT
jgi:hypothetical protein